jgi:hypothetical protein
MMSLSPICLDEKVLKIIYIFAPFRLEDLILLKTELR